MTQQNTEFFAVYIGGPFSMSKTVVETTLSIAAMPCILGPVNSRYVCGQMIHLVQPERGVAIYGFADPCRTVRAEIFRVVAVLSFLIRSTGDVDVAMHRLREIQEQAEFMVPEAVTEKQALCSTVQRQAGESKLQQRLLAKGAVQ